MKRRKETDMNVRQLIREKYDTLTKSEKKVANYVLSASDRVVHGTMNDIKTYTNVGDATIIRFCQKLGYSGYSDLKIDIAKDDYYEKETHATNNDLFDQSELDLYKTISITKKMLNQDSLEKAVDLIPTAKPAYIFGVGSSGNTGRDLEAMFLRIGVQLKVVTDPHFQAQIASILRSDDLVIGISLSGKTKDIIDSLSIARKNEAKIISITNYLLSPIAQLSDVVLQTATDDFFDGGSLSGKFSQLFICEMLVKYYEKKDKIGSLEKRESVVRSIIDKAIE